MSMTPQPTREPTHVTGSPAEPGAAPVAALDVDSTSLEQLEGEIVAWAGRLAAATCNWLLMAAAFDRRQGWSGQGFATCAHWLAWRCGLSVRTAREHLAVGHRLTSLPAVRDAFAAGRLSYSKARAVARVAEPASEQTWLNHALCCTAAQLERLAATYERLTADHTGHRAARRVAWRTDTDGMLRLTAVLPADEGAKLVAALDAARASLTATAPPAADGGTEPAPADGEIVAAPRDRRADADALVAMADGFLHRPAPGLLQPSHTVTVHVDLDTLLTGGRPGSDVPSGGAAEPAGEAAERLADAGSSATSHRSARRRADVEPGVALPVPVLRRLGCDAMVRALITDADGNPLHLGRRRRFPSTRLRDAVYARDHGTCQYPGCEHTRWLQIHHLAAWVDDEGETAVDNLTLTCAQHHHALHDDGVTLRREPDGTLLATLPDGRILRPAPAVDPGPSPVETLAAAQHDVAADAASTRNGGQLHLDDSMIVLTQRLWRDTLRATPRQNEGAIDRAALDPLTRTDARDARRRPGRRVRGPRRRQASLVDG
jgi:hypothetical protein